MEYVSTSTEETMQLAKRFVSGLLSNEKSATVVGLYGNLGAGKTTFVQCVAKTLGVSDTITSPTFLIMKSYPLSGTTFKCLVHVDAYRLKSGEELRKISFDQTLSDPANLIFVEWPEHVLEILPPHHAKIHFEFVNETTRRMRI